MALIHEILPRVMRDIGCLEKNQTNRNQGYQFRGIDDVLNHCGPVFARHGIVPAPSIVDHAVTSHVMKTKNGDKPRFHAVLTLCVTLYATDGSSVEFRAAGEAFSVDGDKATAAAMSNAFKYAMFFGLCIPVDRDCIEDGDRNGHELEDSPQDRALPKRDGNGAKAATQDDLAEQFEERISAAATMAELREIGGDIKARITDDAHKAALRDLYTARAAEMAKVQLDVFDATVA